jgi:hypothetical protein
MPSCRNDKYVNLFNPHHYQDGRRSGNSDTETHRLAQPYNSVQEYFHGHCSHSTEWLSSWLHGVMTSPNHTVLPSLQTLGELPTTELRKLYEQQFDHAPPKNASAGFLRYNLAWAKQAIKQGHDPMALRKILIDQLQTCLGVNARKPLLSPGTRIIREWQGLVYEVMVTDGGYVWEGQTYKSLSPIATTITGTRWSGPKFFGIKGQASISYTTSGDIL